LFWGPLNANLKKGKRKKTIDEYIVGRPRVIDSYSEHERNEEAAEGKVYNYYSNLVYNRKGSPETMRRWGEKRKRGRQSGNLQSIGSDERGNCPKNRRRKAHQGEQGLWSEKEYESISNNLRGISKKGEQETKAADETSIVKQGGKSYQKTRLLKHSLKVGMLCIESSTPNRDQNRNIQARPTTRCLNPLSWLANQWTKGKRSARKQRLL